MSIKAVSKVNLGLNVKPKQPGFSKHEIYSLMTKIDWLYDVIDIQLNPSAHTVTYFHNHQPLEIENCLILKTLAYLDQKYHLHHFYDIVIHKNIPIGSGLGGGSSDAASVIQFVCAHEHIDHLDWYEIALEVGSDIPFFLSNSQSAIVCAYGNEIHPLELPNNLKLSLHFSKQKVSTAIIFQEFDILNQKVDNINNYQLFLNAIHTQQSINLINDLQPICLAKYPDLHEVWSQCQQWHDYVTLSGSGPTIIGLDYKKG